MFSCLFPARCEAAEEYIILTNYLALPSSPSKLFSEEIMQIVRHRITDPSVRASVASNKRPLMPVEYPLTVNTLVDLPVDYSDLINSASKFM